jgi:hypothetical protein
MDHKDAAEANGDELPAYTWDEIAEHNSLDSCWKVIEGKVYDFTDYIPDHPTPPEVMERWCGKESTEAMRTKGYGRDHSPAAWAMIDAVPDRDGGGMTEVGYLSLRKPPPASSRNRHKPMPGTSHTTWQPRRSSKRKVPALSSLRPGRQE